MRVASIKLRNFKRFSDLLITDIPKSAKLVVIVGPNGCGKSSLFDAFLHWYRLKASFGMNQDALYYRKDPVDEFNWHHTVEVNLHDNEQAKKGSLYVRTAYRNDPDFSVDGINRPANPSEGVRVNRSIDNDQTVSDNYRRLVYDTMSGVYNEANNQKSVRDLREELIGGIRSSMQNVFGDLLLNSVSDPLGAGAFYFEKGVSKSYHYKNLSGGEKAAFDLLLDLHVKRRFFSDAIYSVDELETHLHTRVQGKLLKEMVKILPEACQLWVTTHSLGVLRAAEEMIAVDPTSVCLIDFDGVDPDVPRQIVPSSLGRVTWEKLISIALDDLSPRIAPKNVVICEGTAIGTRRNQVSESSGTYRNRAISTVEFIEEMIKMAKDLSAADKRGVDLGLSAEEIAFYDALAANESAKQVMGDDKLRVIATELVMQVRKNVTTDWTLREGAQAKIRVMVKRILNKYGYPPDLQDAAVQTVLAQAKLLCADWAT